MNNPNEKIFAWEGVQFPIPEDWDLSWYVYQRNGIELIFEDAVEVRLQVEWQLRTDDKSFKQGKKRYRELWDNLQRVAVKEDKVEELSPYWRLQLFLMDDERRLLTAFWTGMHEQPESMAFLCIHSLPGQPKDQFIKLARRLLEGFSWPKDKVRQWRVYGLNLQVPERFKLQQTSFLAGRKMMIFECCLRRLFVWQFSLVSRMCRDQEVADVVMDFISRSKDLPGVKAGRTIAGELCIRKKPIHIFGHYKNIARLCFRYRLVYYVDTQQDKLLIMVFHYRREADLDWMKTLEPGFS